MLFFRVHKQRLSVGHLVGHWLSFLYNFWMHSSDWLGHIVTCKTWWIYRFIDLLHHHHLWLLDSGTVWHFWNANAGKVKVTLSSSTISYGKLHKLLGTNSMSQHGITVFHEDESLFTPFKKSFKTSLWDSQQKNNQSVPSKKPMLPCTLLE